MEADMQEPNELDELLGETPPQGKPEPQAEQPAATETPVEAAPGADSVAPPATQPEDDETTGSVPRKAVLDERRKRQDAEKRLRELEAKLTERQPPQEQEQPPPDWYIQPDQAAAALQQQFQVEIYQTRVAIGEEIMRERHADYDEVTGLFAATAASDPRLLDQVLRHPNPVKFAYETGKRIKLFQEIGGDPAAYEAKLREKILAEMGQPPGAPAKPSPTDKPVVPRSLARDVSQQPRNARGQFDSPASLDELLG